MDPTPTRDERDEGDERAERDEPAARVERAARNRRTGAALGVIAAAGGLIVLGVVLDPPLGTVFLVSAVVLAATGFFAAVREAGRR